MNSILDFIKKQLGIPEECDDFDVSIIGEINSVFQILYQLGASNKSDFMIENNTTTWDDFLEGNRKMEGVKTYMHKKVKMAFDPPLSGAAMEALKRIIDELEWRLSVSEDITKEVEGNESWR